MKLFNFSKKQMTIDKLNENLSVSVDELYKLITQKFDSTDQKLLRIEERSKNMGKRIIDMDKKIDDIRKHNINSNTNTSKQ